MSKPIAALAAYTFLYVMLLPACSFASPLIDVKPGYDLYQTQADTTYNFGGGPVPLEGVPIGSFNFGGSIGVQNVGNTDTIVQRIGDAIAPSLPGTAPTITTQMLALDMQTIAPIDIGAGIHYYFITLQSATASTGTMDITFNDGTGGTFNSSLDVFFDIRQDSLTGPIVNATDVTFSQSGDTWGRTAPAGALTISGVNLDLNGLSTAADFWPGVPFTENHPGIGAHTVTDASVPEPTCVGLLGASALYLLRRSTRAKRAC